VGCRDDRAGSEGCAEGSRGVVPRGREGCAGGREKRVVPRRGRKEGHAGSDFIILVCHYDRLGLWGCAGGQEGCALKINYDRPRAHV
jgi:hypothetical protein